MKHKDTYKAYTKLKKNKQDTFYNEHTAEIILFESARKYLKEHLGESKTLNIFKWKSEVANMKKEKKREGFGLIPAVVGKKDFSMHRRWLFYIWKMGSGE